MKGQLSFCMSLRKGISYKDSLIKKRGIQMEPSLPRQCSFFLLQFFTSYGKESSRKEDANYDADHHQSATYYFQCHNVLLQDI